VIKSYEQIVGHKNKVEWLRNAVAKDSVPDVIIFHGNPGLGKSSLAKLVAIDVATKFAGAELRERYVQQIIEEGVSTDSVKLFNMSQIQEKEEEIQKVKAELVVGFSSTGRKVLILDEAHNMSSKAQDAILTDLENLQQGVYVFICTTEIGALRDALVSRSKATIQLRDLTEVECKRLIRREIAGRHIKFDMSEEMAVTFIASWAGNQPRKVLNLLENFPEGAYIRSKELEVFVNTNGAASVIELMKYLYGSMSLGLGYIESLVIDKTFVDMLVEVTRVAVGGNSAAMSREEVIYVRTFMAERSVTHLVRFCAEVAGLEYLVKRRVVAAFLRCHVDYRKGEAPVEKSQERVKAQDLQVVAENIVNPELYAFDVEGPKVPTLEELLANAEEVEG